MLKSGFRCSILKSQAAGADSDNHVHKHAHEWLQTYYEVDHLIPLSLDALIPFVSFGAIDKNIALELLCERRA